MLFERTAMTPQGRLQALVSHFEKTARRDAPVPEAGHVPLETLEAYGDFATHVRYLLESAAPQSKEQKTLLTKIERLLNALPHELMEALPTGPEGNWMAFYRRLLQLHGWIMEAEIPLEEAEYATFVQKMVALAENVSRHSAVEVNAASMFTLMLLQVELQRQRPAKRRRPARRKKRKTSKAKTAGKTPAKVKPKKAEERA